MKGPLCINIVKMYNNELDRSFIAYGRVISGTIHENQEVKVLCENYDCRDSEDMYITKVEKEIISDDFFISSKTKTPVQYDGEFLGYLPMQIKNTKRTINLLVKEELNVQAD